MNSQKCACGCGKDVAVNAASRKFNKYVHGHHMRGRIPSEETRRKIGEKNSVNTKEFLAVHPEEVARRSAAMQSGRNEETEARRIEASNEWKRSDAGRATASRRVKKLWTDDRQKMMDAVKKAGQTSHEGFTSGRLIRTEEQKDKISAAITQKYLDGGFQWSRGKHISPKLLGRPFAYYRSSWELRHMREMDADPAVISYQYEPHVIYYEWQGRRRRYVPDFLVSFSDGRVELQEVGVKAVKDLARSVEKLEAGKQWAEEENCSFRLISF